jgi:predicted nuclease with TOPRIM domain
MSTLKEVEALLRKSKKENRELKKDNDEKDLHIKFLNERLDNWADKNAQLREEKLKITVDDVIAFQKAKSEYASSQDQSFVDQLEKQEQVKLDSQGIVNEQRSEA